jgi:uncharacterized protein (TIRG00374 family)
LKRPKDAFATTLDADCMHDEQAGVPVEHHLRVSALLSGLLLLAALIGFVFNIGEIERFIELAREAAPSWLVLGVVLQCGTYVCQARAWQYALQSLGLSPGLTTLIPLSIAKLFSDQAMPSAGLSGTAFLIAALRRYGVGSAQALACLVLSLVAHFVSSLLMAIVNLLILAWYHTLNRWIVTVTIIFSLVALLIPLAVLEIRWRSSAIGTLLARHIPRLAESLKIFRDVPIVLPHQPALLMQQLVLHSMVILLDALSLWAMLKALGQDASFLIAVASFVTASMVASLSPIPLGLGTFEATSVAMLRLLGIGLEAGLMATILLRGMTVWLPMLPGIWLMRRELRRKTPDSRHG